MKKCNKCKNTEFEIMERSNTYNVKGSTNIEIQERVMQCSTCGEIIFNEELEKENRDWSIVSSWFIFSGLYR